MSQFIVNGFDLNGLDRTGEWKVTGESGVWDTPEVKSYDSQRPLDDGDFDLPSFWESRVMELSGRVQAKNHDLLHAAFDTLKGLMPDRTGILSVNGHGAEVFTRVKLNGRIEARTVTDTYGQWALPLRAPDPRWYRSRLPVVLNPGESVTVTQKGNTTAWPVITVKGDLQGYSITGAGRRWDVTVPLVSPNRHTLDMRVGIVRVNENYWTGSSSKSEVFGVPPHTPVTVSFTGTGNGTASIDLPDAYI